MGIQKNTELFVIPETPAISMGHIREKLNNESGELDIKEQELAHKRLVNLSIFLGIAGGIAIVIFLLFVFKDTLALAFENLSIQLTQKEMTLEYKAYPNAFIEGNEPEFRTIKVIRHPEYEQVRLNRTKQKATC